MYFLNSCIPTQNGDVPQTFFHENKFDCAPFPRNLNTDCSFRCGFSDWTSTKLTSWPPPHPPLSYGHIVKTRALDAKYHLQSVCEHNRNSVVRKERRLGSWQPQRCSKHATFSPPHKDTSNECVEAFLCTLFPTTLSGTHFPTELCTCVFIPLVTPGQPCWFGNAVPGGPNLCLPGMSFFTALCFFSLFFLLLSASMCSLGDL